MSASSIYMDYAATTPADPRVIEAMNKCCGIGGAFANSASMHKLGRQAADVVNHARGQLGYLLNTSPDRLIWTSGATESDNLAIRGAAYARAHRGKHLVTMLTEHKAVIDTFKALEKDGFETTWLAPRKDGMLDIDDLAEVLRVDTQLVSIMHVNNETGVVQDICAISELCRGNDVLFHCDAAQSVGKLEVDLQEMQVDLLSLTAHKFYGPQGIGALYIADRPRGGIFPITFGGGQEKRLRPGTLPVHQIAGLGCAAEIASAELEENIQHVQSMRDRLWAGISDIPGLLRNGDSDSSYAGILNVSVSDVEGESLILGMDPVCVASGSACNSTNNDPSHVLMALGCSSIEAQAAIRFSFGRLTTLADIDFAIKQYRTTVEHLRSIAPAS